VLAALDAYDVERPSDSGLPALLREARDRFAEALDDDLNISAALAAVFDLVRELNRRVDAATLSSADASAAAAFLRDLDRVLGVMEEEVEQLNPELSQMLAEREAARSRREWATSDRLRDALAERGILIEDTKAGQRWRRAAETRRG
jgi:cysteinyl-tRNA synthetase